MSATTTGLHDSHRDYLAERGIPDEVVAERGYFTAESAAALGRLGFTMAQRGAPALVLPLHGVDGKVVGYQKRADQPRVNPSTGKLAKFESPVNAEVRLDVPPRCRPLLGSTRTPLWVTEGIPKGDALAARGLCAVGLLGVDCFVCDDWDRVALDERNVYVAYDSDVVRKRSVQGALGRLATYLSARGSIVHFVYLPEDGGKVGVDDYLAAGGTVESLYALAQGELVELPPEPAPKRAPALPTAMLLGAVEKLVRRFVRFPSGHERAALALFVLHTYALEAAQTTPYMLIVSPEKRSGKTRGLETVELVVREPLRAASITAAGVFQAIEAWRPTLLIDEVDAIFNAKAKSEQAEALRGVLNAGSREGSCVVRGTQDGAPVKYGTYCPKVLAGINTGTLPDTIRDRAIVLNIERLRRDEDPVEDLFPADLAEGLERLRGYLDDWAAETVEWLRAWRRAERIRALDSRMQEAWDPLLAIAEHAAGDWPARAHAAAVALAEGAVDAAEQANGHLALVALKGMFAADGAALTSKAICAALNDDEELPFGGYSNGAGLSPRTLAKLLKPYAIKPRSVREVGATGTAKGYHRDQFEEAWKRYTDDDTPIAHEGPVKQAAQAAHPAHPSPHGNDDVPDVPDVPDTRRVDDARMPPFDAIAPAGSDPASNGHVVVEAPAPRPELREPTCPRPEHRHADWAMPGATMWVCGVCHPPASPLAAYDLVRRTAS